jgi:hypothetical protein
MEVKSHIYEARNVGTSGYESIAYCINTYSQKTKTTYAEAGQMELQLY